MATTDNSSLIYKDENGDVAYVRSLTDSDITKIKTNISDVADLKGKMDTLVDEDGPIKATQSQYGVVKYATAEEVEAGTAAVAIDAAQLKDAIENIPVLGADFTISETAPDVETLENDRGVFYPASNLIAD